jgi:hypothetical protein
MYRDTCSCKPLTLPAVGRPAHRLIQWLKYSFIRDDEWIVRVGHKSTSCDLSLAKSRDQQQQHSYPGQNRRTVGIVIEHFARHQRETIIQLGIVQTQAMGFDPDIAMGVFQHSYTQIC